MMNFFSISAKHIFLVSAVLQITRHTILKNPCVYEDIILGLRSALPYLLTSERSFEYLLDLRLVRSPRQFFALCLITFRT